MPHGIGSMKPPARSIGEPEKAPTSWHRRISENSQSFLSPASWRRVCAT
jgi:hypothetical protein